MLRHAKNGTPTPPFPLDTYLNLLPMDLSYAGGLVDGEGCVHLYRFSGRVRIGISVAMTDREPVDFMAGLFGGRVTQHDPNRGNRKRVYTWRRNSRVAGAVVKALIPYLRIPGKIRAAHAVIRIAEVLEIAYQWENSIVEGMLAHRKKVEDEVTTEFDLVDYRQRIVDGESYRIDTVQVA